jgi:hypothetical protein
MSKRNDPVARARGRKAAPVKKPFPLGFVAGAGTLVIFLGAIIAYAATHQGLGDKSSLTYARAHVSGLKSFSDLDHNHVDGPVAYPDQKDTPPAGGNHNGVAQSCQAYTAPIASEHAVHSLEHGAVWVTYNPDKVDAKGIATLKSDLEDDPYRLLSPYPGLKSAVSLQAWGEQLFVDSPSDKRVKEFLKLFTNGPQTRERGGACQGTTATGPVAAATTPTPGQSTMPAATPTPTAK